MLTASSTLRREGGRGARSGVDRSPTILSPFKISDSDMVADIFTKAVDRAKFTRMRDFVMNVHSSLRVQLEAGLVTAVGASQRMMCSLIKRL